MSADCNIASLLNSGSFLITVGVVPPTEADATSLIATAQGLKDTAHAVIVSDGGGAHMAGLAACVHLSATGIETVLELSTRDMNRVALQSTLIGAASLGVGAVVCATGVHQRLTDSKESRGVFDIDPIQLLGSANSTGMLAGTVTNPFSDPIELQVLGLEKAIKAGAKFVITAPVFHIERFNEWMEIVRQRGLHNKIHIIAGVLPLETRDEALDLRERFRGIDIPDNVVERIDLNFAAEIARTLSNTEGVRGIHIHPADDGRAKRLLNVVGINR